MGGTASSPEEGGAAAAGAQRAGGRPAAPGGGSFAPLPRAGVAGPDSEIVTVTAPGRAGDADADSALRAAVPPAFRGERLDAGACAAMCAQLQGHIASMDGVCFDKQRALCARMQAAEAAAARHLGRTFASKADGDAFRTQLMDVAQLARRSRDAEAAVSRLVVGADALQRLLAAEQARKQAATGAPPPPAPLPPVSVYSAARRAAEAAQG